MKIKVSGVSRIIMILNETYVLTLIRTVLFEVLILSLYVSPSMLVMTEYEGKITWISITLYTRLFLIKIYRIQSYRI